MSAYRTPPASGASAASMFAGNLLLALGWVAMSGQFDVVEVAAVQLMEPAGYIEAVLGGGDR